MPRVGVVAGMQVYVQDERNAKHKEAHCHFYGSGFVVVMNIRTLDLIHGSFPRNKRKEAMAWARRHQGALLENYMNVQDDLPITWIGG